MTKRRNNFDCEVFLGALLMIFDPFVFYLSNETVFLLIRMELEVKGK